AGIDAIVTGLFIAMIKMDGENCIRKNLFRRSNHGFEHTFVGVTSGPFESWIMKWRFALDISSEQSQQLLHIINIVSADGELSVGHLVELGGSDDHKYFRNGIEDRMETRRNAQIKSEIENLK